MIEEAPKLLPVPNDMEEQAKTFVERGIPGDSLNNIMGAKMNLQSGNYEKVAQVGTYEDYIRTKFGGFESGVAEAVINASDTELVGAYNQKIVEINAEIGDGVSSKEQANRALDKISELSDIIYGK